MESSSLVYGAYYWLKLRPDVGFDGVTGDLYIGQCRIFEFRRRMGFDGPDEISFDVCGDDESYSGDYFDILEIIEYKGNK